MKINGKKIKCVIWDLDDTLWSGTLAEGDDVVAYDWLIEAVMELDRVGVVNSICSKNDFENAKARLTLLGIWDYFVFPIIDFVPKGLNVKSIIENFQLSDENCLFVDDNESNLNEVAHYCPEINYANPFDEGFREYISSLITETHGQSRLNQYKILEEKKTQAQAYDDNDKFLADSAITVCILRNPEDLVYKDRIIELANRTNQLNFTKSRFPDDAAFAAEFELDDSIHMHHGVVFAHDKYGDYGLVGFFAFDERGRYNRRLSHFFFSCRIMNMGVETAIARHLADNYNVDASTVLSKYSAQEGAYVTIRQGADERTRDFIANKIHLDEDAVTVVIAGCTSGVISHYLPPTLLPCNFQNFTLSAMNFDKQSAYENVVYTVYSDYITKGWSKYKLFSYKKFENHLQTFLEQNADKQVFLLMASEKYGDEKPESFKEHLKAIESALLHGRSPKRNAKCNAIVRSKAVAHANVHAIAMDDFVTSETEVINARHFHRNVIKRACLQIGSMRSRN